MTSSPFIIIESAQIGWWSDETKECINALPQIRIPVVGIGIDEEFTAISGNNKRLGDLRFGGSDNGLGMRNLFPVRSGIVRSLLFLKSLRHTNILALAGDQSNDISAFASLRATIA